LAPLSAWLETHGVGSGTLQKVEKLGGGMRHLVIGFEQDGRPLVLKTPVPRAPPGESGRLRREIAVLQALKSTNVPHAALVAAGEGLSGPGIAFHVTERVKGFNPVQGLSAQCRNDPRLCRTLGLSLIEALAALARVDPAAVGLKRNDEELAPWRPELASYAKFHRWPGHRDLGALEEVRAWLEKNCPPPSMPCLVHGDYHIGNVLFAGDTGQAVAIMDWEFAALSNPLADLGRLLAVWPDPDGQTPFIHKIEPWRGFPERDALIEAYRAATGKTLNELLWFEVFACYKQAVMSERNHADPGRGPMSRALALLEKR
jgi:aminoglycoside phosphotransferase (APT) family kinase protein